MRWMTSGGSRPLTLVAPMRTCGGFVRCEPPRRPWPEPKPCPVPVPHGTLFALRARARAALFVVGVVLGDLLGLLLLHLLLGGGLEVLLDEVLLVGRDAVLVGHAERRHEERHRREQARVRGEREARVKERLRVEVEMPGDDLAGVHARHLEDD